MATTFLRVTSAINSSTVGVGGTAAGGFSTGSGSSRAGLPVVYGCGSSWGVVASGDGDSPKSASVRAFFRRSGSLNDGTGERLEFAEGGSFASSCPLIDLERSGCCASTGVSGPKFVGLGMKDAGRVGGGRLSTMDCNRAFTLLDLSFRADHVGDGGTAATCVFSDSLFSDRALY